MPYTSQKWLSLDSQLETLCQLFISNNLKTGNFGSLITVFLEKAAKLLPLSDQERFEIWQTFNALFFIRLLVKYIIETDSEFQLLQHFEGIPSPDLLRAEAAAASKAIVVDGSKLETLIDAIVNLIVVIPVKKFTYDLHLEAVNTIHLRSSQRRSRFFSDDDEKKRTCKCHAVKSEIASFRLDAVSAALKTVSRKVCNVVVVV